MDDYEELLAEQEEEQLAEALADEQQAEFEVQLEHDNEPPQIDEPPETHKLKRDIEREALARLESAARTTDDFKNVVAWWDRLDNNRERKERYHEISRSGLDIPLDYGAALDGEIIPYDVNDVLIKQIRKVRATALKKIHKALLKVLLSRKEKGYPLTMEEKLFIEKALDGSKCN